MTVLHRVMPATREQLTKLRLAWADVLYAISDVFQGWANEVYIKGSRARASETEDRLADVRADLERSGFPASRPRAPSTMGSSRTRTHRQPSPIIKRRGA